MIVACPACAARYALPERLLGPSGCRVTCRRCHEAFVIAPQAPRVPVRVPTLRMPAFDDERAIAGAHARGRLFAEHGPQLCAAFEAFVDAGGEPARFREWLAQRCDVRLAPLG